MYEFCVLILLLILFYSVPPLRDDMKQMFTTIISIQEEVCFIRWTWVLHVFRHLLQLDNLASILPPTLQIPKFNNRTNYKQLLKKEEDSSSSSWSRLFQSGWDIQFTIKIEYHFTPMSHTLHSTPASLLTSLLFKAPCLLSVCLMFNFFFVSFCFFCRLTTIGN